MTLVDLWKEVEKSLFPQEHDLIEKLSLGFMKPFSTAVQSISCLELDMLLVQYWPINIILTLNMKKADNQGKFGRRPADSDFWVRIIDAIM